MSRRHCFEYVAWGVWAWGVWLSVMACACAASTSADELWPPASMGGRQPARGPLEDPALNPATGIPYDDMPFCEGPTRVLKARERIELNGGDSVNARSVARWAGSYRCDLWTPGDAQARAALAVEVRMVDEPPPSTCSGPDGGVVMAAATVSMQLSAADGSTLHDGPCSSLATVSVWPERTNLRVTCSELVLELRAGWVLLQPRETLLSESKIYLADCHAAGGD